MDIVEKINEAVSGKILKSIDWSKLMYDFFAMADDIKYMHMAAIDQQKSVSKMNDIEKKLTKMMLNLNNFVQAWPELEKAHKAAQKEVKKWNNGPKIG